LEAHERDVEERFSAFCEVVEKRVVSSIRFDVVVADAGVSEY
jgi:hypothetical protein